MTALESLKTVRNIPKPYSVVSLAGIKGLFESCCDCSYVFIMDFLEYQGYCLPITSSPNMVMAAALDCGIIVSESLWTELIETRNNFAQNYDEEKAVKAIEKILSEYIPAFEELQQNIEENWLNI